MTDTQIRAKQQFFLQNAALLAVFAGEIAKRRQKIIFAIGVRGEPSFFIYVLNPLELKDPNGKALTPFANGNTTETRDGAFGDGTPYQITIVSPYDGKIDTYFRMGPDGETMPAREVTVTVNHGEDGEHTITQEYDYGGYTHNVGDGVTNMLPEGISTKDVTSITVTVTVSDTSETITENIVVTPPPPPPPQPTGDDI